MRCPPAGDLRARPERLLEAADVSVLVGNPPLEDDLPERTYRVRTALFGAETADGERMSIDRLRAMRLGLVLGVARPERILEALSENGIEPCTTRLYADHSPMTQIGETYSPRPPEAWLTTAKCATKLAERLAGAAVLTLDHRLSVPDALLERVAALG